MLIKYYFFILYAQQCAHGCAIWEGSEMLLAGKLLPKVHRTCEWFHVTEIKKYLLEIKKEGRSKDASTSMGYLYD